MVLKASCRSATPKSTLSAWASLCTLYSSSLLPSGPLQGFCPACTAPHSAPKLAPLFLQISAQTSASAETSLGHPVSTTTHAPGTLCALYLLFYYYFFQTTCHHPKFIFSTFSVLIALLPTTLVSSVRVGPSGPPPQPLCPEQGCCRNGWVHSARSYRWTSGCWIGVSFLMGLTGTHLITYLVIRVVSGGILVCFHHLS